MIEVINFILGAVLIVVMLFFAYMSSHLVSEKKAGHTIPLPWEKGSKLRKVFDKNQVKYKDGDNT